MFSLIKVKIDLLKLKVILFWLYDYVYFINPKYVINIRLQFICSYHLPSMETLEIH